MPGSALDELVHQIANVNRLLRMAGESVASNAGQTHARRLVLQSIVASDATVADLARGLGLARQSVQRVADILVKEGLATYDDNPHHARAKLLHITGSGRDALSAIRTSHDDWIRSIEDQFSEDELRSASSLLERVGQVLRHSPIRSGYSHPYPEA